MREAVHILENSPQKIEILLKQVMREDSGWFQEKKGGTLRALISRKTSALQRTKTFSRCAQKIEQLHIVSWRRPAIRWNRSSVCIKNLYATIRPSGNLPSHVCYPY